MRYLLGFWVLNCADELVQLISHGLCVHTTGGRFEVLFIGWHEDRQWIGDIFCGYSPWRMHPWREVSEFPALPRTLCFEGMGVERKGRRFFWLNVGEREKVLYGFPIRNELSNVLGVQKSF